MRLKSRLLALIVPPEASRPLRLAYAGLYAVVTAIAFLMIVVLRNANSSLDAQGYIRAAQLLSTFQPDVQRPFVYPALLLISLKTVGLTYIALSTQVIQWMLFIISITPFRLAASRLMPRANGWWVFAATSLYALNPGILYYNDILRAETLTVVLCSFFLAALLRGVVEVRTPSMVKAALWLALLIFTRPVFICFIPVYIILIILMRLQMATRVSRLCISSSVAIIGVIALCEIYARVINRHYGIHSMTIVTIDNNYFLLRQADLVHPETATSPALKVALEMYTDSTIPKHILKNLDRNTEAWDAEWGRYNNILRAIPPADMEAYVNQMLVAHPEAIRSTLGYRVGSIIFQYDTFQWWFLMWRLGVKRYILFSMGHTLILLLVIGVALLVYWIRRRRLPLPLAVVWAMPTVLLISNILGAQAEYSRLFTPCVGVFTLLLVCLTQKAVTILHAKLAH